MLPAGWDLARIREHVPGSQLLDPSKFDVLWVVDVDKFQPLEARTVIDCGGLCLVLADPEEGWWMGQLDRSRGAIVCWGIYGPHDDLGAALAAV